MVYHKEQFFDWEIFQKFFSIKFTFHLFKMALYYFLDSVEILKSKLVEKYHPGILSLQLFIML